MHLQPVYIKHVLRSSLTTLSCKEYSAYCAARAASCAVHLDVLAGICCSSTEAEVRHHALPTHASPALAVSASLLALQHVAALQAALALTTDLDPSVPTIAFLITDAPPHLTSDDPSPTNTHELRFLRDRRRLPEHDAADFFKCFQATAFNHFGGNLILNCVVYNDVFTDGPDAPPSATQRLYGSLAQQTGGMLMEPDSSRDSSVLARGLTAVVCKLIARMQGVRLPAGNQRQQQRGVGLGQSGYGMPGLLGRHAPASAPNEDDDGVELRGFKLLDLAGLNAERACESDEEGSVVYGDSEVLFEIAMKRMVAGEMTDASVLSCS
jgi:hypothetical protein